MLIFAKYRSKVLQNGPREHSAILSAFIKLLFVFKNIVLYIFVWALKTGFTVNNFQYPQGPASVCLLFVSCSLFIFHKRLAYIQGYCWPKNDGGIGGPLKWANAHSNHLVLLNGHINGHFLCKIFLL